MKTTRWRLREPDSASVRDLVRRDALPEPVARMLVARGHGDSEAVAKHLSASPMGLHDPFLLPGMEAATERIARALRDGETILVHGDYDVDGVTGTSLLMRLFELLGGKAVWHIPNRLVDGYSFGEHSLRRASEVGASVVISVDNGTSAHDVIASLKERGIDTVVTDHHEAPPGPLPVATAIVNPKLADATYPFREICGGAVAFKLAWGLAQRISGKRKATPELKEFLEEATAYVAIATVCDVVPLLDENRIFATYGLKALRTTKRPGLKALLEIAGLGQRRVSAEDVGFQIGPRINASGRLGSAQKAVELLLANDMETARGLAQELDDLNAQRKLIEAEVLVEAKLQAEAYADEAAHPVLVLAGEGWHQGVVGIVAARITEAYGRPAVVIGLTDGEGRGSARSVEGFSILEAMSGGGEHTMRFGGHAAAAGLEIKAERIEDFRRAVCAKTEAMLEGAGHPTPELLIDYELPFPEMNGLLMKQIDRLEPFGEQNEKPILLSRGLRLAEPPRQVGADRSHLLLRLRHGSHVLKAMAFGMAPRLDELQIGRDIDAVYTPRWNQFRGETNLELQLHDFRCPT